MTVRDVPGTGCVFTIKLPRRALAEGKERHAYGNYWRRLCSRSASNGHDAHGDIENVLCFVRQTDRRRISSGFALVGDDGPIPGHATVTRVTRGRQGSIGTPAGARLA